jgi:flagellar basal body-associated protein FliL
MTSSPSSQPTEDRPGSRLRDRRLLALIVLAVVVVLVLAAAAAVWIVFFSSPAPAAPTLDDALRVLLPSAAPGG